MSGLQCYFAHKYASLEECDDIPDQCIAPTKKHTRCNWNVSDEDVAQASTLRQEARALSDGPERDRKVAEFIFLHCCTKQHRWRLRQDNSGCLTQLVNSYGARMGTDILSKACEASVQPATPPVSPFPQHVPNTTSVEEGVRPYTSFFGARPTTPPTFKISQYALPTPPVSNEPPTSKIRSNLTPPVETPSKPVRPSMTTTGTSTSSERQSPNKDLFAKQQDLERQLQEFKNQMDEFRQKSQVNALSTRIQELEHLLKVVQQENDNSKSELHVSKAQVEHCEKNHTHLIGEEGFFIPYVSEPSDTIRGDLLQDINPNWDEEGTVYSFIWPAYTDFVKIGYTSGWSADDRMSHWQKCHTGAMLSWSTYFKFPQRIERLIHLEMAKYRFRTKECPVHKCSHEEWFRLPLHEVHQVINDWTELTRREPLYDSRRQLSLKWRQRIESMDGEITARTLLDLLDREMLERANSTFGRGGTTTPEMLIPVESIESIERVPTSRIPIRRSQRVVNATQATQIKSASAPPDPTTQREQTPLELYTGPRSPPQEQTMVESKSRQTRIGKIKEKSENAMNFIRRSTRNTAPPQMRRVGLE